MNATMQNDEKKVQIYIVAIEQKMEKHDKDDMQLVIQENIEDEPL